MLWIGNYICTDNIILKFWQWRKPQWGIFFPWNRLPGGGYPRFFVRMAKIQNWFSCFIPEWEGFFVHLGQKLVKVHQINPGQGISPAPKMIPTPGLCGVVGGFIIAAMGARICAPRRKEILIMACFLVPAAEAVAATVVSKGMKKASTSEERISFSRKLGWLSKLLWGGSALLCFEHIWHGEVVPFFPFLTAMNDPAETAVMLSEMASVGSSMAIWLTAVWAGMVLVADNLMKRPALEQARA